ncbi:hypothetical protein [Mammaliicoccus sciuri]|uniref:hypothetical protein n=1 Tax=Mammaliicoccus sciuri TaxID=1296 RepID=UPI00065BEAB9|nr:hypothetical protein [Mammaliicoccus sciuri]PNY95864.1 hypothetical protein CD035_02570 [Mammaliicoccus sciuri]WRY62632.1 hypothetical protein P8F79_10765 [Mammaliicoccus sciuri]CAG7914356.1 hypothetical protein SSCS72_02155 [Mammaliicoccus sciuri]SFV43749.1 Hypothetical protein SSCIU_00538 [Mammaliicoccus sciuri]SQE51222.1 membrane protein [Mammaliicoccus sciuri]
MFNIVLDICILVVSLTISIYVAISKNINIIASIEHDKVNPENIAKISYIFSTCLFLGTVLIVAGDLVYDFNFILSIFFIILGFSVLLLFYVLFMMIEKK